MDSSVHGIWGFSRKKYWRGLPFPPPGDLPNTMIDPASPESSALASEFFTTKLPGKPQKIRNIQPGEEPEPAEVLAEGEQEYWSGLPFPTPGDLPNPRIEHHLLCLLQWQVDSLPLVPPGKPLEDTLRFS